MTRLVTSLFNTRCPAIRREIDANHDMRKLACLFLVICAASGSIHAAQQTESRIAARVDDECPVSVNSFAPLVAFARRDRGARRRRCGGIADDERRRDRPQSVSAITPLLLSKGHPTRSSGGNRHLTTGRSSAKLPRAY